MQDREATTRLLATDAARQPSPPPVVRARGLTKAFGERLAVRGIDLDVPQGGCFGFLGPNGAGKTTTLRMILGQSPPTAGRLEVFGLPVSTHIAEIRARIGVVPQADNADPDFTVAENLRMYARYFRLPAAVVKPRIRELLEFMELAERADEPIKSLSGGMKRRLTIARALINDPELIILDEPTTGLDPQVRRMIWNRLRQLGRAGKTLLLTTHYLDEAERLCHDLVVMDDGCIVAQGAPAELIAAHVEPQVVEIPGDMARIRGLLDGIAGLRIEQVGETGYCYTSELAPVLQKLGEVPGLRYLHRPTTLEDVFLRITGHGLRGG
ncbi:MAG: ATP-binding cassette domain-containing protein [Gammaproteobacteria bacterium]|nr:ATP-binding cassette domain-containing protein [Gammaproteobacteria bacterium]